MAVRGVDGPVRASHPGGWWRPGKWRGVWVCSPAHRRRRPASSRRATRSRHADSGRASRGHRLHRTIATRHLRTVSRGRRRQVRPCVAERSRVPGLAWIPSCPLGAVRRSALADRRQDSTHVTLPPTPAGRPGGRFSRHPVRTMQALTAVASEGSSTTTPAGSARKGASR